MYVPRIPNFEDPYDREWMLLVAMFLFGMAVWGVFLALVNPLLQ